MLVHVDTSAHDFSCPLQSNILSASRAHHVVEEDVAAQLRAVGEIEEVTRVEVFYLEGGLSVQAHARMPDHCTVAELRDVARRGRQLLLDSSPDLIDAAVSVDLSEPWAPPAPPAPLVEAEAESAASSAAAELSSPRA